jgi:hypothetical protein
MYMHIASIVQGSTFQVRNISAKIAHHWLQSLLLLSNGPELVLHRPQGLGASEKEKKNKKNYIILQGGENDSLTHGKVCTQMGSGHPSVCTTSDFHAVLFWFVYDTSAVRRPTLTI